MNIMKLKKILSAVTLITAVLTSNAALAADEAPSSSDLIKQQFAKLGLTVTSLADSPLAGLTQVMTNRGLFYASNDGKHFVHGKVYQVGDDIKNLTEEAMAAIRLDTMKSTEGTTIDFNAKDEKHKVTIFTDTSCGYCRKLHEKMDEYNDLGISVRYLAYPRSGVSGATYRELESIWCAKDPQQALTAAKAGDGVKNAKCISPVASHYQMGGQLGVTGTPAIILSNGNMIPGYQPPAQLLKVLETL